MKCDGMKKILIESKLGFSLSLKQKKNGKVLYHEFLLIT